MTLQNLIFAEDRLHLTSKDQLSGLLLFASKKDGIGWQHESGLPPARFQHEAVLAIDLKPLKRDLRPSWRQCFIRFSNGDELRGRLQKMGEKEAILETWYAGNLAFSREDWQWVVFENEPQKPMFEGPKGIDEWTIGDISKTSPSRSSNGKWVYHKAAFYATQAASIARDLDLPDRVCIEFDLHWKGTLSLAIALFTDSLHPVSLANKDREPSFGGFYSLQLNSYFANVLRVKQKVPLQYLGQVQTPNFAKQRKAEIEIRVDQSHRSITLFVDGKRIKQWIDKTGFVGQGRGLRVVHQGQGAVRLANLKVIPWNGQFEETPQIRAGAKDDQITLRDGDSLNGKVLSLEEEIINLKLAGSVLSMPLRDVKKIEFGGVANVKMQKGSRDLHAQFDHKGGIHLELIEVKNGRLRGMNDHFGSVDIALRAFNRLSF